MLAPMAAAKNSGRPWRGGAVAALAAWLAAASDLVAHHGVLDPLSTGLVVVGAIAMAIPRINKVRGSIPLFGDEPAEFAVNEEFVDALDTADAASDLAVRASETANAEAEVFDVVARSGAAANRSCA